MIVIRVLVGIILMYCLFLILIRLLNKETTCMTFRPVFMFGCMSYGYLIFIYFCFLFGNLEKYKINTWIGGVVSLVLSLISSLILLSLSCSWRIVIKNNCYIYYNFFGIRHKYLFSGIEPKNSGYSMANRTIYLFYNGKKIIMKWPLGTNTKQMIESLSSLNIKMIKK